MKFEGQVEDYDGCYRGGDSELRYWILGLVAQFIFFNEILVQVS